MVELLMHLYAEYFQAVGTRYGVQQRLTVPSLSAEPNSIQGLGISQRDPANDNEIKGTIIAWDNSTKLLTVENETSVLSDVAGLLAFTPVDEVPGRGALFVSSSVPDDFTQILSLPMDLLTRRILTGLQSKSCCIFCQKTGHARTSSCWICLI